MRIAVALRFGRRLVAGCPRHPGSRAAVLAYAVIEMKSIRGGLVAAVTALASPALAQQAETEAIEEVVVTGSRIPRVDLEGVAPVAVYTAADIDRSGATSIGQLLREIPSVSGRAQTTQVNYGGSGVTQVSLRGLGAVRTLVLLNGRRVTPSVDEGANGISVDLNTIPTAIIERVEVLKDGASAAYGSDAVAGVVNIITKRRFEGFELSAYWGDTTRGGGSRGQIDVVTGSGGNGNRWLFAASATDEEEIEVTDREWAVVPLFQAAGDIIFLGSSAPPWGRYRISERSANRDCNDDNKIDETICDDLTLGPEYGDFRAFDYFGGDSYNYAPANYQRQPNQRWSLSFFGETRLDALSGMGVPGDAAGYVEATYTNRESSQKLAEVPLAPLAFFGYPAPYSRDNYYNPLGFDVDDWRRRMVEGGSRTRPGDEDTIRLLAGARGDWSEGALAGWSWDAYVIHGESRRVERFGDVYNLERVANAVGPTTGSPATGDLRCVNDAANCVPLNAFGRNSVTQEMLDYVTFTTNESFSLEQRIYSAQLSTAALFDLPAGGVGFAFGYEFRDEFAADAPDSRVAALGDAVTGMPRQPTSGGYDVSEIHFEAVVPVIENLELEAAARYSSYDAFGSTTNPKIGLRWRPIEELVLRGTFSTAFRAPNVGDLYGGAGSSFPSLSDPCKGGRLMGNVCMDPRVPDAGFEVISTQIRARVGGNPDLTPEEADVFTVGAVWTPEARLTGFTLALDYYDYQLANAIGGLGADFILKACAERGELCERIDRFPDGNVRELDNRTANVAGLDSRGVDLVVEYSDITLPKGTLDMRVDLTRVLKHDVVQPDGEIIEHAGWFRDEQDGHFGAWKFLLSLRYALNERFNVSLDTRFIDDAKEEYDDLFTSETHTRTLAGAVYHDLQANWAFDLGSAASVLTFGVDNLLDEDPPFSLDALNDNTDVRTFDTAGRFVYARVRLRL